jgi:hypothetical protein
MGAYLNAQSNAANLSMQGATAKANAKIAKRQAYADAYKLEADAASAAKIAGDNMMTLRQNETAQRASARLAGAMSGFSGNNTREMSVAEYFEKVLGDASRSNAIQSANAQAQATQLRHQGDSQYQMGIVQGNAYQAMASVQSSYAPWVGVGGALSTIGQLGMMYNIGTSTNNIGGK